MDLAELTETRAPHIADGLPARLASFAEEGERLLAASRLGVRHPEESGRRPAHAAPGSRQNQAALQLGDRPVEIAFDGVEAPQRVGRHDAVELVAARLGDADRLVSERDRLVELAEVAEGQGEPGPRPDENHRRAQSEPRHPEACQRLPDLSSPFLPLPLVTPNAGIGNARESRTHGVDDPAQQVASPDKLAELMARHAEAIVNDCLQVEFAELGRDRQGLLAGLDRAVEIERRSRMNALQRENPGQPTAVLEPHREILGPAQRFLELLELSECRQWPLQLELEIDRLGDRVALGEMRDRREGLLETADGLAVGRATRRPGSRLTKIRDGLGPYLAAHGVMRELIGLLGEAIGILPLDRLHDRSVQLAAPIRKQARVGDLVREHVRERVLTLGVLLRLLDELGVTQRSHARLETRVGYAGDHPEDGYPYVHSNDSR